MKRSSSVSTKAKMPETQERKVPKPRPTIPRKSFGEGKLLLIERWIFRHRINEIMRLPPLHRGAQLVPEPFRNGTF